MTTEHKLKLERKHKQPPGRRYRAVCSCKWEGEWRRHADDARQDGYLHLAGGTP